MIQPAVAAARFGWALVLGGVLGLWYGFLRPLRPKHTAISDGLFMLGCLWAWIYHSFAVSRGDPRTGYLAGLAMGAVLWEMTLGRWFHPLFRGFWKKMEGLWRALTVPLKKFLKNVKILFASVEKWVTIRWNNRRHSRRIPGGGHHGENEKSLPQCPGGVPPELADDQNCGNCGYRIVYRGADYPALDTAGYPGADGRGGKRRINQEN